MLATKRLLETCHNTQQILQPEIIFSFLKLQESIEWNASVYYYLFNEQESLQAQAITPDLLNKRINKTKIKSPAPTNRTRT